MNISPLNFNGPSWKVFHISYTSFTISWNWWLWCSQFLSDCISMWISLHVRGGRWSLKKYCHRFLVKFQRFCYLEFFMWCLLKVSISFARLRKSWPHLCLISQSLEFTICHYSKASKTSSDFLSKKNISCQITDYYFICIFQKICIISKTWTARELSTKTKIQTC